jgi:tRNA(Arg) A34 adenosine deaminase TadA
MTEPQRQTFMRRAIALSRENVKRGGGPFGAVVVKGNEIIGEGFNRVTATNDPTAHAEVVAIRQACARLGTFSLAGCEIYTSCEPCPMCLSAIYWARLGRIWFANTKVDAAASDFDDHFIYDELAKDAAHRSIPMEPMLRDEALVAFREWKANVARVPY